MPCGIFDRNFGGVLGGGLGGGFGGGLGGCGGGFGGCDGRFGRGCDDKKGCFVSAVRAGCFSGDLDTDKMWL